MLHIAERFLIHFVSSAFLVLCFYFALEFWIRRNAKVGIWISSSKNHLLVISALLVAALIPLRAPYDLYFGKQTVIKTIFDQASWYIGSAGFAWGLYRFAKKST